MTTAAQAWTGWHRLQGKHQSWRAVTTGDSWKDAWDKLLAYPILGDRMVLKTGAAPEASHNRARRANQ